jgi:hypothetical protein
MIVAPASPVRAASQPKASGSETMYSNLNFQVALFAIDERTLNASISLFISANIDNKTAPAFLEVTVNENNYPYFDFQIPIRNRNAAYAFYQLYRVLTFPLGYINPVLYPWDSYELNLTIAIVPYHYFDTNSTKLDITDAPIIVQTLSVFSWDVVSGRTITTAIGSNGELLIRGITISMTRQPFIAEQVGIPIYGIVWLAGGTMAIQARRIKDEKEGISNRLTVFVAAFIGLTGYSFILNAHLPDNFALPSMATLLVIGTEVTVVVFAFATFLDAYLDSPLHALIVDTAAVALALYLLLWWIVRIDLSQGLTYGFWDIPKLAEYLVIGGLVSGIAIRYLILLSIQARQKLTTILSGIGPMRKSNRYANGAFMAYGIAIGFAGNFVPERNLWTLAVSLAAFAVAYLIMAFLSHDRNTGLDYVLQTFVLAIAAISPLERNLPSAFWAVVFIIIGCICMFLTLRNH